MVSSAIAILERSSYITSAITDLLVDIVVAKDLVHYINSQSKLLFLSIWKISYPFGAHRGRCGGCR